MNISNKIKNQESYKRYYKKHRIEICRKTKAYKSKNKEKISEQNKRYRANNKELVSIISKKYYRENKERILKNQKERYNKYYNNRRAFDDNFKIITNLRSRIRTAIKKQKTIKNKRTLEILGCSLVELKSYLESLFKEGMEWGNYGFMGWHIDHIKPCSSFDLTDPKQQEQCFHYTNMQPLWWYDNIKKGNK